MSASLCRRIRRINTARFSAGQYVRDEYGAKAMSSYRDPDDDDDWNEQPEPDEEDDGDDPEEEEDSEIRPSSARR